MQDIKKDITVNKNCAETNYAEWESFDADKECTKLDLEEEKRIEENQQKELAEKKKQEIENSLSPEEKEERAIDELIGKFRQYRLLNDFL